MESSIKKFNSLHEYAREAMTLEEANTEGECNFTDNEPTRKAFDDFAKDFENFCEEQNAVEGEPFAQDAPSIEYYLKLHKATRKATRKLKIGLTAPPVMEFSTRGGRKIKATPVLRPVQTDTVQATPKHVASAKPTSPILGFRDYVKSSRNKNFKDAVFFLPNECKEDMQNNAEVFVTRHAFPNKGLVLNKLKLWRSKMKTNPAEANSIKITSLTGQSHYIGNIAFNFSSFNNAYANRDKDIPFISLMGVSKIKQ